MFMQSLYAVKTQSEIEKLVLMQPTPTIFYKISLDLGIKSLINYISFDSRSMKSLLSEKNKDFFSADFPLFYKNENGRSELDTALDRNQIRSVNMIVNYIVNFQNSYVYSNLFKYNFVDLVNKGVTLKPLLQSNIFQYTFEFEEWPATNQNTQQMLKPYNDSIFKLRNQYHKVFPELYMADNQRKIKKALMMDDDNQNKKTKKDIESEKEFKIQYQINLLPSMSEEDGLLIQSIALSNDLDIFTCSVVEDMINYKWQAFASRVHWFGWIIHIIYIIALQTYISEIYLANTEVKVAPIVFLYIIGACLIYPVFYDGRQMWKQGLRYVDDKWNYVDVFHLSMGYVNLFCQAFLDPSNVTCKLVIIIVILTCLIKQFFFMRVVMSFSYIVTMIISVIRDLSVFLTFYVILMVSFSMVFNIIAINESPEYSKVGSAVGNLLTTLRLSLGDFNFDLLNGLNTKQHYMFWVIWVIMVLFSALIFLNFIIAEVSNSYQKVKETIQSQIFKERATLVSEVEEMVGKEAKANNKIQFPEFIVVRQVEG